MTAPHTATPTADRPGPIPGRHGLRVVLSFDVEEHHRIEAAAGLEVDAALKDHYADRARRVTASLLELLAGRGVEATFFIVGELARREPGLVREIRAAGHEVASHGWDHRPIVRMTPDAFREDICRSKDTLEQITGEPVVGYRAPTFSVVRGTAWALDILADAGFLYDSSIYPVRHDRYGIPDAPREPFLAEGPRRSILELPPASYRLSAMNIPTGGGGYFRLLPLAALRATLRQIRLHSRVPVAMLYFHPWEFDPGQPRLRLGRVGRFRTYVGIGRTTDRLDALLCGGHQFCRAEAVARDLTRHTDLPRYACH